VAGFVLLAAVEFLVRLARASRISQVEPALPSRLKLWALASCCLTVIYSLQEWLEGQVELGHPAGLGGIFGRGGWLAILLSVAIGAAVAFALRGASAVIELVAPRRRSRQKDLLPRLRPPAATHAPKLDVLAAHLAGRGPPRLFV
jgi:hypothetical protein